MEFPKVWDKKHWRIVKNQEDYWIELKNKDKKLVGTKTVYESIGGIGNGKILELNFFKKGAAVQMWFTDIGGGMTDFLFSRVMQNGKWVYGMPNKKVTLEALVSGDLKLKGIRAQLEIKPKEIIKVDFYKPGSEPKPGNFPD